MEDYKLGLGTFKYNQIFLIVFSLILISINFILGATLYFWIFFVAGLLIINSIWYTFSDVRYNKRSFIIEKFLLKKEISSDKFVKVEKLPFNIFVIKFTDSKFYTMGNFSSFFESANDLTDNIKKWQNAI